MYLGNELPCLKKYVSDFMSGVDKVYYIDSIFDNNE